MQVKLLQVGEIGTNCYLLLDEQAKRAAVIDPGDEAERILAAVTDSGCAVDYILLTHGHYDHTTAVPAVLAAWPQAQVYIHPLDADGAGGRLFPLSQQVKDLKHYDEGDTLTLGTLTIEVLHTPGHSPGCVTLKVGDALFTGDTLFEGTCGRCDLRGGSYDTMLKSLKRLGEIEGEYHVLPGHEGTSMLSRERKTNPYMLEAAQK